YTTLFRSCCSPAAPCWCATGTTTLISGRPPIRRSPRYARTSRSSWSQRRRRQLQPFSRSSPSIRCQTDGRRSAGWSGGLGYTCPRSAGARRERSNHSSACPRDVGGRRVQLRERLAVDRHRLGALFPRTAFRVARHQDRVVLRLYPLDEPPRLVFERAAASHALGIEDD